MNKVPNDVILEELARIAAQQAVDLAIERGAVRMLRLELAEARATQQKEDEPDAG